jgi:GWxTD domain-containing protein
MLLVGAPGMARAVDDEGPGPLPWRVRGPVGFTVDAAAFPDSAGQSLEVYVRVPPTTLRPLVAGSGVEASMRLSVRLRNQFGARQHEAAQEFSVAPADTGGFGKVVVMRFPVRRGGYRMRVQLEDLQSRKRGLAYVGRTVHSSNAVEGELSVPLQQAGREISDVEFVWGEAPSSTAGVFRRGDRGLLPNPERLYGLLAGELRAVFIARGPAGDARPWRWSARVLSAENQVVAAAESSAAAGPWLTQSVGFDLSSAPAGSYLLEIKAWQEGDVGSLLRRASFDVAWQLASWSADPLDVEDAVHFLFEGDEEKRFVRMGPGAQERYLEEFWRRRDPTPGTAENESRTAFGRRIEHANRTWGRYGLGKGMFSDMGRVFIRYGEPDEVLKQVIPAGDQTLLQILAELEQSEERPTGDVHQKGLGGDTRAFEVWIYDGRPGSLLSMEGSPGRRRKRILFLFVDEQGYGDYTLRYTTE